MGGSHYNLINNCIGNNAPIVDAKTGLKIFNRMAEAAGRGLLRACHDLSEGGIAVALAEMAFSGGFGADAELGNIPCDVKKDNVILFSESNTRFIVEVRKAHKKAFEDLMKGIPTGLIGEVSGKKDLRIYGVKGKKIIEAGIAELKEAWQKPLRW